MYTTRMIELQKTQLGWRCVISFTYASVEQFTDLTQWEVGHGKWWLTAYLSARRSVRLFLNIHAAKPGERAAKGWSD